MKPLNDANPAAVFVYFLCTLLAVSFSMNPVMLLISLAGAVSLLCFLPQNESAKTHLLFFLLFIIMAAVNPLFNHNGATVLFIMNNNPVTLEALIYGGCASLMIVTVLYWLRVFTKIMTADKLLCLFGSVSPKLALLFSMTVRYVPLFSRQKKKVRLAQKGLGLAEDESIPGKIRASARIFSIMVTWGLENGIITADSMTSRGYGTARRTFYSRYRFTGRDAVFLAAVLLLFAVAICVSALGLIDFAFYPHFLTPAISVPGAAAFISYGILAFLPSFIQAKENIKWKYLQSKI